MQKQPTHTNKKTIINKLRRTKEQNLQTSTFQSEKKGKSNHQNIINNTSSENNQVQLINKGHKIYKPLITSTGDDESDGEIQQVSMTDFNPGTHMGDEDMDKLTQVIKKLVLKNKLNAKNAFDVPVIDVTSLDAIKKNDDSAWSKISSVLQNSSKVYSFRVDFIADSVNKMTNNISRSEKTHQMEVAQKLRSIKLKNKQQSELMGNQFSTFIEEPKNQIYIKHLQKQKINQQWQINSRDVNPFHQNIRRMFDQNGVSGMLLGRLNITSSLNIVIDAGIQYLQVKNQENNRYQSSVNLAKSEQFKRLTIFQEIQMFENVFINPQSPRQFIQDCFNLHFEDLPQICLYKDEDIAVQQDSFLEVLKDSHQQEKIGLLSQENGPFSVRQVSNNDLQNSLNISQLTKFSIVVETFDCFEQGKINKKKKKESQNENKQTKPKRPRRKKQQTVVDFKKDLTMDRKSILSCSIQQEKKKKPRKNQRNIIKKIITDFNISLQTNYAPILKKQVIQPDLGQFNTSYNLPFCPGQPTENYLSNMTMQDSLLRMPNIKTTKKYLWQAMQNKTRTTISKLHEMYEKQKGPVSQTIIFLAVLHLGNEKNLQIVEADNYEIQVNNPHLVQL